VGVTFQRWAIGWLLVAGLAIGLLFYAIATNPPPLIAVDRSQRWMVFIGTACLAPGFWLLARWCKRYDRSARRRIAILLVVLWANLVVLVAVATGLLGGGGLLGLSTFIIWPLRDVALGPDPNRSPGPPPRPLQW
jgi:hypothetical protein